MAADPRVHSRVDVKIIYFDRKTCLVAPMWRPRLGVLMAACGSKRFMLNSCTLDAKLDLPTCTYTGNERYATIVLNFPNMQ